MFRKKFNARNVIIVIMSLCLVYGWKRVLFPITKEQIIYHLVLGSRASSCYSREDAGT